MSQGMLPLPSSRLEKRERRHSQRRVAPRTGLISRAEWKLDYSDQGETAARITCTSDAYRLPETTVVGRSRVAGWLVWLAFRKSFIGRLRVGWSGVARRVESSWRGRPSPGWLEKEGRPATTMRMSKRANVRDERLR